MTDLDFIAKRVQARWERWGDDGPDAEDMPRQHIEDLETLAEAWIQEHKQEVEST